MPSKANSESIQEMLKAQVIQINKRNIEKVKNDDENEKNTTENITIEFSAKILNGTPTGRFVDSEELLGATLFLCDDRSASAITGVVLPVDAGFAAYSGV